jgi:hypothetical protein
MPSPFPGMNPYLEKPELWPDFHDRFLVYAAEILAEQVGGDYFVRLAEHVFVSDLEGEASRTFLTDITGVNGHSITPGNSGAVTITAPAVVTLPASYERDRLTYLEVRDRHDRRVLSVVELLSPSNKKPGRDRTQFEAKRRVFLASDVNYVEIDLLRGWPRMPWGDMSSCDYCVAVSRPDDRPRVDFWPLNLRDPLPEVPVPIAAGRVEPRLNLQTLLHRVYDAARYEREIYTSPPVPPLPPAEAAWAEQLARTATAPR